MWRTGRWRGRQDERHDVSERPDIDQQAAMSSCVGVMESGGAVEGRKAMSRR